MLPTLSGPSRPPAAGGKPRRLVVLLHGVGADGNDLIGLAPFLARLLPDAEFVAPDAPFPAGGFGRQWFSLEDRSPPAMLREVQASAPILDAFLDNALARRGLADDQLALLGFSQGTMMSLHVGFRRAKAPAAILGYSGHLAGAELLAREIRVRPPTLLIHGEADEVVPFPALAIAVAALKAAGVPVQELRRPGLGHSIDEIGLEAGGKFLVEAFARRPAPQG